jgi:2-polyprenyl-3-methyl-5-hydroxy-6-metoxy-1,4-benzoquinol methylase
MLITDAYRAEQAALHATGNYGTAGAAFGPVVSDMVAKTGARTLLDYGCGSRRSLLHALKCTGCEVEYRSFDPAVPQFAAEPEPADCVACIDVLEHIEPELLDQVLDHLRSLTLKHALFSIHTGAAIKTLSDGRNAHLIQQPPSWWLPKIMARYELRTFVRRPDGFVVALSVN